MMVMECNGYAGNQEESIRMEKIHQSLPDSAFLWFFFSFGGLMTNLVIFRSYRARFCDPDSTATCSKTR